MPSFILSDNGVSSGSAGLKSSAGNDGILALQTSSAGGTATTAVTIDTTQQIGIGTSSPADIVHISSASPRLTFTSTNNTSGARYNTVGTATSGSHRFQYNGTEVLTVGISGQTLALQGASPVSGTGISFPATQSASSDANTLDDYEEGTWTPYISFGFGTAGQTYSNQQGYYTKIGNLVTATCYASLSNKGSSVGTARLEGLPFTVGKYSTSGLYLNEISFSGMCCVYAEATTTYIPFLQQAAAGGSNAGLTQTNFTNNSAVMVTISYRV